MNVQLITTYYENNQVRTDVQSLQFVPDVNGIEKGLVNLYPDATFQTLHGFGGALTESSGYVLSKIAPEDRQAILDAYYGKDGLHYTLARSHIDSCDFSLRHYCAIADGDTALKTFSLSEAEKYVLPLIRDANRTYGKTVPLMLTPWSPPEFMKTNADRDHGGYLKPEHYDLWARYLCMTLRAYRDMGFDISLLSVQNEPKAVQTWDSCIFSSEQERVFIRDHLAPIMKAEGLTDIGLLIWDHNKERAYDRAKEVIADAQMDALVEGVAVHWYSGDHFEALDLIKRKYPDKRLVFSEACVEYLVVKNQNQLSNAKMYAHEIIGGINHGLDTFIDWNIALDQEGGPNHVGNYCDAPIICDLATGTWEKRLSYHYIGHFSKYLLPGAKRIGYSKFTQNLECTAAVNLDGSLAAVLMNPTAQDIAFHLRLNDQVCPIMLKANTIATCVIA